MCSRRCDSDTTCISSNLVFTPRWYRHCLYQFLRCICAAAISTVPLSVLTMWSRRDGSDTICISSNLVLAPRRYRYCLAIIVVILLVFINAIRCNGCFFHIHRLSRGPEGILGFLVHYLSPIYKDGVNKHLFLI